MSKRWFVGSLVLFSLLAGVVVGGRVAFAAKPEDVFKGKIIITKNRLPMRFSSPGAFVAALQKGKTDKIGRPKKRDRSRGPGTSSTSRSSRSR